MSSFFSFFFQRKNIYGGMEKMSLSFKTDPRLVEALKKLANKENRSLANYVITVLMNHLKENGIDWREESEKKPQK